MAAKARNRKKKVAIVGATGYTGQELARLLVAHPGVTVAALTSRENEGKCYESFFPQFRGLDLPRISGYEPEKLAREVDLAFFCLPHARSQRAVAEALGPGMKCVDLSADFRLRDPAVYEKWYGPHTEREVLGTAVYGMPEIYRDEIKKAGLVANPGCYPTGVILSLVPLLKGGMIAPDHVIADMKSGVSGAGRKASIPLSYCEVNEGFRPYGLYEHRHAPEMEQELAVAAGKPVRVTFSPHLAPMNRGILGTIYVKLTRKFASVDLIGYLEATYRDEPFVRVIPKGEFPCVSRVRGTNFVDIGISVSPRGDEAIVNTAIDNLVKGASGAAVQNMNLMLGLPETEGLVAAGLRP